MSAYEPVNFNILDEPIDKISEPSTPFSNRFDYKIMRRDLDTNNHVNNLNYLDFAIEALPDAVYNNIHFSSIDVLYKKQCLWGDQISCLYTLNEANQHVIVIKSHDLKDLHSIIVLS